MLLAAKTFDSPKVTLWLLPMHSMWEQYISRFQEHNMSCHIWPLRNHTTELPNHIILHVDQIYLDDHQHGNFEDRFQQFIGIH